MASAPLYHPYDHRRALTVRLGQGTGHEPAWRSPFWRDRARLIHSAAFRRLQGKTQLFAGLESDFFRNRLTHSLEVAQIAVTIARKLNADLGDAGVRLDEDLIEFAALAHDLGHPPFGHTGEAVLDHEMRQHGGFEGNAQTLRILCRLEKKLDDERAQIDQRGPVWYRNGKDAAVGLNLCSRTLASILKYDRAIPLRRTAQDELVKGYYLSELPVVLRIKRDLKVEPGAELQVVECQIMEIADDIAYSTYDLEDAFKGGLLNPLDVLYPDDTVATDVARRVSAELDDTIAPADVRQVLRFLFGFLADPHQAPGGDWRDWYFNEVGDAYGSAENIAAIGFYRTWLTSALVNHFVHAVDLQLDRRRPLLSRVRMQRDQRIQVSVLKQVAYVQLITSPRLRMVAHRGEQVVRSIFQALSAKDGALLPADFYQRFTQASALQRPRVICDFIAGMTDRYATELYARLSSDVFTTMFKPL